MWWVHAIISNLSISLLASAKVSSLKLRKRSPHYPAKTGYKAEFAQPLTLPHADYTPNSTRTRLRQIFDESEFEQLKDAPYDQLK